MATEFISNSWLMPENSNQNKLANYSLDCDGAAQHLTFASAGDSFGNNEAFTFSFWCKVNTMAAYKVFFDFSPPSGFGLLALRTQSTSVIELLKSGSSLGTHTFSDTTNFHNFCIVYDKTDIKLYIDNVEVISSAQTNMGDFTGLDLYLANGFFLTSRLDCKLTEASIFDYALSASQRTQLYGTGSAIGNPMAITNGRKPVAYYPLGNAAFNGEFLASNGAEQDYVFDFAGSAKIEYATPVDLGVVSTFSFWMNIDTGTTGALFGNTLLGTYEYIVYYSGSAFYFKIAGAYADFPNAAAAISTGQWHHVAFVRPSQNEVKCYIDSVLTDTITSWSGTPGSNPIKFDLIGSRPGGGLDYSGKMAQISGFNTALPATGTESVASLYNYGTPPNIASYSGLQAWWELDASATFDGSNWSIPDASSNSNTGTSSGMTAANLVQSDLLISAPYDSFSLQMDGVDEYIDCGNNSSLSFSSDMSASAWVNTSQTTVGNIFSKTYYRLEFAANGILSWAVYETSSSSTFVYSTTAINDGKWHHIVVTHKANGNQNIYVDGQLEGTASANTGIHTTTHDFFIGRRNATHSRIMDGNLSNIAVWNTELTSAQVTTLYNKHKPFDLNTFAVTPVSWWRLGAVNSSFDGTDWTVLDENSTSANNGVSANMEQADLTDGVGATGSGTSSGMSSGTNKVGNSPYSENNAVSYNQSVLAISTSVPT